MGVARMVGHVTYLSGQALDDKFAPAAAVRRRHPLHDHRAGVRGRELPAPPGRLVRQALRRQHLPLHLARADVLRPRPRARRRLAGDGARRRLGADPADRVQLRLALPARRRRRRSTTALRALGKPVELHVIDAPYGHDCFLLEEARQTPLIRELPGRGQAVTVTEPSRRRRPRLRLRDPAAARRAAARTRTPAPARCRSSRRPATCSRTRSRRRRTSTCRSTATPTRGS